MINYTNLEPAFRVRSTVYVVKFVSHVPGKIDAAELEYTHLLDAITVAKRTSIDGHAAMSDQMFNEQLLTLLIRGYLDVNVGHPEKQYMVMLFKRDSKGQECPVYDAYPVIEVNHT